MKTFLRILVATIVLVGGAVLFRLWALQEFNKALTELVPHTDITIPSPITEEVATTTEEIIADVATSTPLALDITFPTKDITLYMGCAYKVALDTTNNITSLEMILVDAGTQKALGPVASGIPTRLETNGSKQIDWRIGTFWPGTYYLHIKKANEQNVDAKSYRFSIEKFKDTRTEEEKKLLCEQSGGVI